MFSRFTASARRVMQRAFREAKRSQHDFVGTLHLLHGLLCEDDGPAAALLRSLAARPELLRQKTELAMQALEGDMAMEQFPLSPASRRVFEAALDEAASLRHQLIGPEHLLLGLASERECEAAQILSAHHVTLTALRAAVAQLPVDSFREAQIQNRDEPRTPVGDNPSVDQLERWLAPAITHDTHTRDPATTVISSWGTIGAIHELEKQLQRTQFLLAVLAGFTFGFWLAGWPMGCVLAAAGFGVALFRSRWVGMVTGALCGPILTPIFHPDLAGTFMPFLMAILGCFVGSFLGGGQQFAMVQSSPPEQTQDLDAALHDEADQDASIRPR